MDQMSFGQEMPRIAAANEPHLACTLLIDTSGSMGRCIENMNRAINTFKETASMDELTRKRVDVAVMTFDDSTNVIMNFTPIAEMEPVNLDTGGMTNMGAAINAAIDLVKERNRFYQSLGTSCFKPWIFMITDGAPTDDITQAIQRIKTEESRNKLKFFAVGAPGYDKKTLFKLTERVIELDNADFTGIFNWLSESMVTISVSRPSDEAKLTPLPEDAKKAERDVSDW